MDFPASPMLISRDAHLALESEHGLEISPARWLCRIRAGNPRAASAVRTCCDRWRWRWPTAPEEGEEVRNSEAPQAPHCDESRKGKRRNEAQDGAPSEDAPKVKTIGAMTGFGMTGKARSGGKFGPMKAPTRTPMPASRFWRYVKPGTDSWVDFTRIRQIEEDDRTSREM
jgi:hypothetical protein